MDQIGKWLKICHVWYQTKRFLIDFGSTGSPQQYTKTLVNSKFNLTSYGRLKGRSFFFVLGKMEDINN